MRRYRYLIRPLLTRHLSPSLLFLIGATFLLIGCLPVDEGSQAGEQIDHSSLQAIEPQPVGELSEGVTVEQSFWVGDAGLNRVTLFLATYDRQNQGTVTFTLLDEAGQIVHRQLLHAAEIEDNQLYHFNFEPQPGSAQRPYTVRLTATSPPGAAITLWSDRPNRYPGELVRAGEPLAGDLLMEWSVRPTVALLLHYLRYELLTYLPHLLLVSLMWTLPGLALLLWIRQGDELPWSAEYLLVSALLLSGSLLVILPQIADLVGLPLGPWAVWALVLLSGLILLGGWWWGLSPGAIRPPDRLTLLYGALVLLLFGSRFLSLHGVATPLWGDSLHHTLITQLILDHGGLFEIYLPYVPLGSFTYHAGFHLLNGWFAWAVLPGGEPLPATTALLLDGQWLNLLAILAVGLLAEGLLHGHGREEAGRWAALLAIFAAGLVSQMPAFYLNWGRYTQLAGQLFLPGALLWSLQGWQPTLPRRRMVPAILVLAALALTHYRVALMYAAALPPLLLFLLWQQRENWHDGVKGAARRIAGSGVVIGALILPWYWTIGEGLLLRVLGFYVVGAGRTQGFSPEHNAFGDITRHVPPLLLVGAALALLWLLFRRRVVGLLVGGWLLLLFVLSNPYTLLRLPGTGLVDNFMLQIALYLPLATLIGLGGGDLLAWITARPRVPTPLITAMMALLLLGSGVWLTWKQSQIADARSHALLMPMDERAAAWIAANTPEDALFHINGFPAFGGGVMAGSDGGWWLWLTARRATTIPPIIYGHERGIEPGYQQGINERFLRLKEAEQEPALLAAVMKAEGVDYLYIGAQQGQAGLPPGETVLDPHLLQASPHFEELYTDDFVWIFRVR